MAQWAQAGLWGLVAGSALLLLTLGGLLMIRWYGRIV